MFHDRCNHYSSRYNIVYKVTVIRSGCLYTGCSLNIVFSPRILESLPPLPRLDSAAMVVQKNFQPIGVTIHSHCVESFVNDECEGGVVVNCEKNTNFPEHLVDG